MVPPHLGTVTEAKVKLSLVTRRGTRSKLHGWEVLLKGVDDASGQNSESMSGTKWAGHTLVGLGCQWKRGTTIPILGPNAGLSLAGCQWQWQCSASGSEVPLAMSPSRTWLSRTG